MAYMKQSKDYESYIEINPFAFAWLGLFSPQGRI